MLCRNDGDAVYAAEIGQEIAALAQDGETSGTCGDDLTWKFDEATGTLTISGTGEMDDYNHFEYPWYGLNFTTAVIEDGVTSIGAYAFFGCHSLTSVTIPDSVKNIGLATFEDCDFLSSVTIPDSVTNISDFAFLSCKSLISLTIPVNVTSIGYLAFGFCDSLTYVTIKNPDCEIPDYANTFSNEEDESGDPYFNGTIYGYENSTAQTYAENCGYNFKSLGEAPEQGGTENIPGDADGDGELTLTDVIAMQKYILTGGSLSHAENCDINGDGILNVIDLALMKKELLRTQS